MPVEIFCCYARKDQQLLNVLKVHLMPLQRQGLITIWVDADIGAGNEWEREIEKHLNTAQIILLLVSPDFMASDYCYSKEMRRAIERHERGEALVIPIILRPTLWLDTPLGKLQALPKNAKPVIEWRNRSSALLSVAEGVHRAVIKTLERRTSDIKAYQEHEPHEAIHDTDNDFFKTIDNLNDFLERAVRELERITKTDYNQILLFTDSTNVQNLVTVAEIFPPHKQGYRISSFVGLVGSAYLQRKTINAKNVRNEPRYLQAVLETKSELVVPIVKEGVAFGVLNSESEELAHFDDEIQQAVEQLASTLGDLLPKLGWRSDMPFDVIPYIQRYKMP